MWTRTDTIQYEYSSIHNGRYRYEYSVHHDVPATYIIRSGRSLRERKLTHNGGTLHPRLKNADHQRIATNQLAHSVSCKTGSFVEALVRLTVETVVITGCWWRGWVSSVAGGQDPLLRHHGVMGRLV